MAGNLRTTERVPTCKEGMTNPKNQRPYKLDVSGYQFHGDKATPVSRRTAYKHFITAQNAAFDAVCSGPRGSSARVTFEPNDGRMFLMLTVDFDEQCRTIKADLHWRRAAAVEANQARYGKKPGEKW